MNGTNLAELRVNLPDSDKAFFEKAKENAGKAAGNLIEAALADPDEVIGAYLKGLPPLPTNAASPWFSRNTYVEKLMLKRPEVFKAAAANEVAMHALSDAGSNAPMNRNMSRMMEIGSAILAYAQHHSNTCPPSLSVLFEKGEYLKPALEAKSVLTGKPYVYVASGEKVPEKWIESAQFILLYDDKLSPEGNYQCVRGDGIGGPQSAAEVKKQLLERGK
jgi:hypothetical protein